MVMGLLPARRGGVGSFQRVPFLVCLVACVIGVQAVGEVDVDSVISAAPEQTQPPTEPPSLPAQTQAPDTSAVAAMKTKMKDLESENNAELKNVLKVQEDVTRTQTSLAVASTAATGEEIANAKALLDPNKGVALAQQREQAAKEASAAAAKKIQQIKDSNAELVKTAHGASAEARRLATKAAADAQADNVTRLQQKMAKVKKTSTTEIASIEKEIEEQSSKRAAQAISKIDQILKTKLATLLKKKEGINERIDDTTQEEPENVNAKESKVIMLQSLNAALVANGDKIKDVKKVAAEDTKLAKDRIKLAAREKAADSEQKLGRAMTLEKSAKDMEKKASLAVQTAMAGGETGALDDDSSIKEVQAQAEVSLAQKDEDKAKLNEEVEEKKLDGAVMQMTADAAAPLVNTAAAAVTKELNTKVAQKQDKKHKLTIKLDHVQTVAAIQTEKLKTDALSGLEGNGLEELAANRAVAQEEIAAVKSVLAAQNVAASQVKTLRSEEPGKILQAKEEATKHAEREIATALQGAKTRSAESILAEQRSAAKKKTDESNRLMREDVTLTLEQKEAGEELQHAGDTVLQMQDKADQVKADALVKIDQLREESSKVQDSAAVAVISNKIAALNAAIKESQNKVAVAHAEALKEKLAGQKLVSDAKASRAGKPAGDDAIEAVSVEATAALQKAAGFVDESVKTQITLKKLEASIRETEKQAERAKKQIARANQREKIAEFTQVLHRENLELETAKSAYTKMKNKLAKKAAEASAAASAATKDKANETQQKADASKPPDISELKSKRAKLDTQIKALERQAQSTKQAIDEFKTATKITAIMAQRVEKAEYMTGVAKESLSRAVEERELAVASKNDVKKASRDVRKYTERITMSEKTQSQDKQLLKLAQDRLKISKAQFPSTADSDKDVADLRQTAANLEKQQLTDQADMMKLLDAKESGPKMEESKERVGKVAVEIKVTQQLKAAAKLKQKVVKEAATKVARARRHSRADDVEQAQEEQLNEVAYAHKEKKSKATGKEAEAAKATKDAAQLAKLQAAATLKAEEARKDSVVESANKVQEAKETTEKKQIQEEGAAKMERKAKAHLKAKTQRELAAKAVETAKTKLEQGKKEEIKIELKVKKATSVAAKKLLEKKERKSKEDEKALARSAKEKSSKELRDKKEKARNLRWRNKRKKEEERSKDTYKKGVERANKKMAQTTKVFLDVRRINQELHRNLEQALSQERAASKAQHEVQARMDSVQKEISSQIRAQEHTEEVEEKKLVDNEQRECAKAKKANLNSKQDFFDAKPAGKKAARQAAKEAAINLGEKEAAATENQGLRDRFKANLLANRRKLKEAKASLLKFTFKIKEGNKKVEKISSELQVLVIDKDRNGKEQKKANSAEDAASLAVQAANTALKQSQNKAEYDDLIKVVASKKTELVAQTKATAQTIKPLIEEMTTLGKSSNNIKNALAQARQDLGDFKLAHQTAVEDIASAENDLTKALRSKVQKEVELKKKDYHLQVATLQADIDRESRNIGQATSLAQKNQAKKKEVEFAQALKVLQGTEESLNNNAIKESKDKVSMKALVIERDLLEAKLRLATRKTQQKSRFCLEKKTLAARSDQVVTKVENRRSDQDTELNDAMRKYKSAVFEGEKLMGTQPASRSAVQGRGIRSSDEVVELGSL